MKTKLKIEYKKLEELKLDPNNARLHSENQISQIAKSIESFGFVNPVLHKNGLIIAGHGRFAAATELNLVHVPTINLEHLSDVQRQALVIADNKLAENASWDNDILKEQIKLLESFDFDIEALGFEDWEIENLFDEWDSDIEVKEFDDTVGGDTVGDEVVIIVDNAEQKDDFTNHLTLWLNNESPISAKIKP